MVLLGYSTSLLFNDLYFCYSLCPCMKPYSIYRWISMIQIINMKTCAISKYFTYKLYLWKRLLKRLNSQMVDLMIEYFDLI